MSWLIFVIQAKWIVCACVKMSTLSFMFLAPNQFYARATRRIYNTHKTIWNSITITLMLNRCCMSFYPRNLREMLEVLIEQLFLCVVERGFEFVMWVWSRYTQHIAQAVNAFMYDSCMYDIVELSVWR